MKMSEQVKLSPEAQKALQDQAIKGKVDELSNLSRLVVNTLNLICSNDVKIPSAYAQPVAEIQAWLQGMHKNITPQLEAMKALLPKEEADKVATAEIKPEVAAAVDAGTPKAVALDVVSPDAPKA
jgi:DNA-binding NtrC family response regulator